MPRPYQAKCLVCGRSKADEPDMFYQRVRRTGVFLSSHCRPCRRQLLRDRRLNETRTCTVPGCAQKLRARGLCGMHWHRVRRCGDPGEAGRRKAPKGSGTIGPGGYHRVKQGNRPIMRHRAVMEEILGRPLRPEETVHHRNGVRHDNRPENLELWTRSHPPGQRVEDKVEWAKSLLELYVPKEQLVKWAESLDDERTAQDP